MPLLSVIIPIYNVEKYIIQFLDSLITQIDDEVEVICVDDGSTDKSGSICDEYAQKQSNFMVLHTANKGVAAARNLGMRKAKGENIAWVDPDDYILKDWYITIKSILIEYKPDILVFDYDVIRDSKLETITYKKTKGILDKNSFMQDIVEDQKIQSQLWQKVFRSTLIKKFIFPEEYKCMEDYSILHKIIEQSVSIYYVNKPLYCYRVRDDGLVKEVDLEKSYQCFLIAKDRFEYIQKNNKEISKLGYLTQALGFCIQYWKISAEKRIIYKDKYHCLRNLIKSNIVYILRQDMQGYVKRNFLCSYFGIINFALKVKKALGKES